MNMKKICILFSLILLTSAVSFGQASSTYKETLKKMMEVSGSQATYKAAVTQMMSMFKQQKSGVPEVFWEEFEVMANKMAGEDLLNMLLPIYQKHLSENDVKNIIAFYQTPSGKTFAEKTPLIMQESMAAGQQWGMKIGEELQKKLKEKGY
jgi:hypothetical protein